MNKDNLGAYFFVGIFFTVGIVWFVLLAYATTMNIKECEELGYDNHIGHKIIDGTQYIGCKREVIIDGNLIQESKWFVNSGDNDK